MCKHFSLVLLLLCISLVKGNAQQLFLLKGLAQGTDYSISYYADEPLLKQAEIDSILLEIDLSMSLYRPDSRISIFNAGQLDMQMDEHMLKVMKKSFEVYRLTQGRFDVTVAPLVQAWGFGAKPVQQFPDSAEIKEILKTVGMANLSIRGSSLHRKKKGIKIDLNGIAQGYSVDLVADHMLARGITSFIAEIGGELRMQGKKPDGEGFRIGVEGPALKSRAEPVIRHVISFDQGAVTTSGNYRKFLEQGGHKVSHLINPVTGYPLDNQLISVTVYAEDALTADGYDNALMAMEPEAVLEFIKLIPGMEVYLIYRKADGVIDEMMSPGFRKMIIN
ncbi:FAD:protein FMN transferase [Pedobacter antarcticus]|uniref:FAD:protein FMN transferase n=1 Tax=Pedobacter antarcticus TaxID=34086 RepID=UPI001C572EBD|nr:FAD:protein FMN transferase [Pedobacter antarcticus]